MSSGQAVGRVGGEKTQERPSADELHVVLYTSELAPGATIDDVAAIARVSRVNNLRDDISGLLIFDGRCFAQLIEGPPAPLDRLFGRIRADPRHHALTTLAEGAFGRERRFADWRMGYLFIERQGGDIDRLRTKTDRRAIAHFLALVPDLDIDLADALPAH